MNLRILFSGLLVLGGASGAFGSGLPKSTVLVMLKGLQDSSVDVRIAAAQAFVQVPDESAARPLENALIASADPGEQNALAAALEAVGDKNSAKRLMDALGNPQFRWGSGAKAHAVEVVGKIGGKKAVKWLTDLCAGDEQPAVKASALRALGQIGAPPKKEEKR